MIIHANTTREEFIEFLYYACADAGMSTPVLDQINALRDIENLEAQIDECEETLRETREDAFDLYDELRCLVETIEQREDLVPRMPEGGIALAKKALVRHAEYK